MKNYLIFLLLCFFIIPANSSALTINTTYDLSRGYNKKPPLDNGTVSISNGDHVDLTINFKDDMALYMGDGMESLYGWLYAGDNSSTFSISNIIFQLLGFSGKGGASSIYNLDQQNGGHAHLGPALYNFLDPGQSVTFTGLRVSYDVDSIGVSPHNYNDLWFLAHGDDLSVVSPAPEPSPLLMLGLGIFLFISLFKQEKVLKIYNKVNKQKRLDFL